MKLNELTRSEVSYVLVATQTMELFVFEYAMTHLKKKESIIVVKENYGVSICSL